MIYTYELAIRAKNETKKGKKPSDLNRIPEYEYETDNSTFIETSSDFDRWGQYHFHRNLELIFVTIGQKIFFLNDKKYVLHENDAFIIESFVPHLVIPDEQNSRQYLIKIPYHYSSMYTSYMKGKRLKTPFIPKEKAIELKSYFETICKDANNLNPILLHANINLLLGKMVDICGTEENTITMPYEKIESIMDYINDNYRSDINLKNLAKHFNYSPYHFSRVFNDIFHIGIPDYVSYVRLTNTIKEFVSTDTFVIDAAYNNGFKSMQTFYRIFHKYYGDISIYSLKK